MYELRTVPEWLKYAMAFIDRVGFPVMAFLLMFYLCFRTLTDNTTVLTEVNKALVALNATLSERDGKLYDSQKIILEEIRRNK